MASARTSPGCGVVAGLLLAVLGGAGCWLTAGKLVTYVESSRWELVPARILTLELIEEDSDGADVYDVLCTYQYERNGRTYTSDRVDLDFQGSRSTARRYHEGVHDQLAGFVERGEALQVLVDPGDPTRALIYRRIPFTVWILGGLAAAAAIAGLVIAALGVGGLGGRARRRTARETFLPDLRMHPDPRGFRLVDHEDTWRGVLALAGLATFWNGIVLIFVGFGIAGWMSGEVSALGALGMAAFLSIFVLVGIGLIWAALKKALIIRRLGAGELVLPYSPLALGDEVAATFRRATKDGRPLHVESLTATLELEESATYTVGTDTRTVSDTMRSLPIEVRRVRTEPGEVTAELALTVPADAYPSFSGGHNRLVWKVKIQLALRDYPEDDSCFELLVAPGVA